MELPKCVACGRADEVEGRYDNWPEPTYNLTPIFDLALTGEPMPNPDKGEFEVVILGKRTDRPRGLRLLDGLTGEASLARINAAIDRLSDERLRDQFAALEPDNGWGDLSGAVWTFGRLRRIAEENKTGTWRIG
jgi:hypothetical protein